jgi:hypothetical protein
MIYRADASAAEGIDESGLPAQAYVPNQTGQQLPVPSAQQGYSTGPVGGVATQPQVPGQSNKTVFDAGAQ